MDYFMSDLYKDVDMTKIMFGQNAIHVPMWMVVQNQAKNIVTFAGSSRSSDLRYGSGKTHVLIVGEMVIRPHYVVANDKFRGYGIGAFIAHLPLIREWIDNGEIIVPAPGMRAK